jgi:hypothetical protein
MKRALDSAGRETSLSARFDAELLDLVQRRNEKLGFPANDTRGLTPEFADWVMQQVSRQPMPMRAALPMRKDDGQPPMVAEFLLTMIASTRSAEAMIGDLNEIFTREREEVGRDRAVHLYWGRALRSLGPLVWRAIGKALKWGAVIAAARRLF